MPDLPKLLIFNFRCSVPYLSSLGKPPAFVPPASTAWDTPQSRASHPLLPASEVFLATLSEITHPHTPPPPPPPPPHAPARTDIASPPMASHLTSPSSLQSCTSMPRRTRWISTSTPPMRGCPPTSPRSLHLPRPRCRPSCPLRLAGRSAWKPCRPPHCPPTSSEDRAADPAQLQCLRGTPEPGRTSQ